MWFCAASKKLRRILALAEENNLMLRAICIRLSREPYGFIISRTGESSMLPIAPGTQAQYTATPSPADAVFSTPPTWVSSDETNAPVTVDATGLIATVDVPSSAPDQTSFNLNISYTRADGRVVMASISDVIVVTPPAPVEVDSFTIERTA